MYGLNPFLVRQYRLQHQLKNALDEADAAVTDAEKQFVEAWKSKGSRQSGMNFGNLKKALDGIARRPAGPNKTTTTPFPTDAEAGQVLAEMIAKAAELVNNSKERQQFLDEWNQKQNVDAVLGTYVAMKQRLDGLRNELRSITETITTYLRDNGGSETLDVEFLPTQSWATLGPEVRFDEDRQRSGWSERVGPSCRAEPRWSSRTTIFGPPKRPCSERTPRRPTRRWPSGTLCRCCV